MKGGLPVEDNKQQVQQAKFTQDQPKQKKEKLTETRNEGDIQEQNQQKVKQQPVRVETKVGRNDPCPCGSGKKYKNCHGQ